MREKNKPVKSCLQFLTDSANPPTGHNKLKNEERTSACAHSLRAVYDYYNCLSESNNSFVEFDCVSCFALDLALFAVDIIKRNDFKIRKDGSLPESYYRFCMDEIYNTDLYDKVSDIELLELYVRQIIHILRAGKVIVSSKGFARIGKVVSSSRSFYMKIFSSFWNDVKWENIFPSSIESARILKENKIILKDLLINKMGLFELDVIANEFFELTGFAVKGDLWQISFLDFYFFTWLEHFGLIRYHSSCARISPVSIELTVSGKKILSSLV